MASCSSRDLPNTTRIRQVKYGYTDAQIDDLSESLIQAFQDTSISDDHKRLYTEQIMPIIYGKESIGRKEMAFWEFLFCDRVKPAFTHKRWHWEFQDPLNNHYRAVFVPKPRSEGYFVIMRSFTQNGEIYQNYHFYRQGSSKFLFYLMLKMAKFYGVSYITHSDSGQQLDIVN